MLDRVRMGMLLAMRNDELGECFAVPCKSPLLLDGLSNISLTYAIEKAGLFLEVTACDDRLLVLCGHFCVVF